MNKILNIYNKQGDIIASVNKWEFSDTVMGEQFLTFDIKTAYPIKWVVGLYCIYRGQEYTLNYIPAATQKAGVGESGEAFIYSNVKMESLAEELTRLIMLDITETDGEYSPAAGTNYTGSSKFSLYCGETKVSGVTYTPVCVLAEKIYANLKRLDKDWTIHVDTTSTHKVNNVDVLNTHTDEKVLSFSNNTIREALEMVNTEFDLDFSIQGRDIYIGYSLGRLTDDTDVTLEDGSHPFFHYGYGKGMPSVDGYGREVESGTALYEIEKTSDSSQKVVTRLRALGSNKNMPYRYYNKKYDLSQSLYPSNLQLPDTFESPKVKEENSTKRRESGLYPDLFEVKGETNDAYIDKDNDAENTEEGIREHCAMWDGSDSELKEIYPTIKEVTYSELRASGTHDMKDRVPTGSLQNAFPGYENSDRVDKIAGIGDLANYGDGLLAEDSTSTQGLVKMVLPSSMQSNRNAQPSDWAGEKVLPKVKMFTISDCAPGNYELTPATGNAFFEFIISAGRLSDTTNIWGGIGFRLYVVDKNGESLLVGPNGNKVSYYESESQEASSRNSEFISVEIPALPDVKKGADTKVSAIRVKTACDVNVYIAPCHYSFVRNGVSVSGVPEEMSLTWRFGLSKEQRGSADERVESSFVWKPSESASTYMNTLFDLYLKDFGVQEMQKCFNTDEEAVISMTSGHCVGREFKIASDVPEKTTITYGGKTVEVWKVRCTRAQDDSLQRYYPSEIDPIAIDDTYVLLNVSMPDSYIKAAEVRLLTAASQYLKDNCDTRFTYRPSIDDIYLQRDYDRCEAKGLKERSIYWRLYAGLKFPFYGIPKDSGDQQIDNIVDVTIQTVTIKEGEGDTPKVDITLNDVIETSTVEKLTTAVDKIYNGSIFNTGAGGAMDIATMRNVVSEYGKNLFLSKIDPDTAQSVITFLEGLTVGSKSFGIDGNGNAIFNILNAISGNFTDTVVTKDLIVTGMAKFFELVVEKVSSVGGAIILTPAEGFVVEQVVKNGNYVSLYWKSTNGNGRAVKNMWKVGDQAFCQSFNNAVAGTSYDISNKLWWYRVSSVKENEEIKFGDETSRYNSITVNIADGLTGSSTDFEAGDNVVMLGSTNVDRQSALYLSSYESIDQGYTDEAGKVLPALKAPFMAQYKGINDFNLAKHRKSYYDATGAHIIGSLTVESSGKTVEQMIEENSAKGISLNTATLVIASNEYGDPYDITPIVITAETGMDGSFTWEIELHSGTKVTPKSEIPVSWYSISGNTLTITSEGITKLCEGYYEQVKVACSMTYESETYSDAINLQIVSDGENGEGKDAVNFIVNPSSLIFETNRDGSISGDKSITISAKRGSKDITDFSVSCLSTTNCVALPGHNNHSFAISIPSRFFQEVTGISGTYKIPPSSGMARFTATIDGVVYYIDVPFVVNLKSVFNSFIVDVNQFKSVYEAFVYNADGSVKEFGTTLKQTAEGISASAQEETEGKLEESGIDINAKRIVAHTGNFVVANNAEGTNPYMTVTSSGIQANNITIDGTGTFKGKLEAATGTFSGALNGANGYFSGFVRKKKTVITSSNFSTYFTYDSSSEWWYPKYSKLANWIYLEYLPEDDTTIVMGKFGTGIQDDDLRELVGTTFLIYNKSGKTLLTTGDLNITGSVFSSVPLANGYMMYLECRVSSVNGVENISWYVVSAKIRV